MRHARACCQLTFGVTAGKVAERLSAEERDGAVYRAKLAVSYGIVQKDFVAVPSALFARTAELKPYPAKSRAYAERLGTKTAG